MFHEYLVLRIVLEAANPQSKPFRITARFQARPTPRITLARDAPDEVVFSNNRCT